MSLTNTGSFGDFVARAQRAGRLVVQPRMGVSDAGAMRSGLLATRNATAAAVGTITLDSYTRMGDNATARAALAAGVELNGYPIVAHDVATTRAVLDGVVGPNFPVQIRHGSPLPEPIVGALIKAGLHATEGGPVSYCLPYSRVPLADSIPNWARSCDLLAEVRTTGVEPHVESFGGCMMGQLCPPGLLVALSVLECLFFRQHGIRSVSLSYAQQTNPDQDTEAVLALRRLAAQWLPHVDWHIVVYTYMGVYPRTPDGASRLLEEAARLAVRTAAARLIVKTVAEGYRIPTFAENVAALETAAAAAERCTTIAGDVVDTGIHAEASALIEAVVELGPDLGAALASAFRRGYLDVPYCLHPDNAGRARSHLDSTARLQWSSIGSMPIRDVVGPTGSTELTAAGLLASLSYVERKFDNASLEQEYRAAPAAIDSPESTADDRDPDPRDPGRSPVTDPGARGAKQVDVDYYGHRYKLMTSAILYKQAALTSFDRIFFIAPNIRLEPLETTSTSRHLAEFHQIDIEVADASRDDAIELAEDLARHVVRRVVEDLPGELQALGRDTGALTELLTEPFGRRTHADAVADLLAMGHDQSPDAEIDWAGEAKLSEKAGKPFFVTDYPKGSRGFYDRESKDQPGMLRNFDLIAAEGYGELCSGSEREQDYATIVARMRETAENPAKYAWYLQMLRDGVPPSAGFGLGLERFTRYVAGLDSVWQASAFPKVPGIASP